MTRTSNARLAGFAFLLYIATGIASMVLFGMATGGAEGTAARLASIARHATLVRVTAVLDLFMFAYAVLLGVTLYALTRDVDRDLALLGLCCRLSEGVMGAVAAARALGLVSVAKAAAAVAAPGGAAARDAAATNALGALWLEMGGLSVPVTATCFALGSTLFCYLFLRGRGIPVALAWLGLLASILLVVGLPLRIAGFIGAPWTIVIWIPMAVFEVTLALWLIFKGVAVPLERAAGNQPSLGGGT